MAIHMDLLDTEQSAANLHETEKTYIQKAPEDHFLFLKAKVTNVV